MGLCFFGNNMQKDKRRKRKCDKSGFTLAELLIVVAIIGVLASVSIPIFSKELEKSREATDLANVRSAYAEVIADVVMNQKDAFFRKVILKQTQDDWQSFDPITIGGITHRKTDGDTDHWKGIPTAHGICTISFQKDTGILFDWTGKTIGHQEPVKIWTSDVHAPLNNTNILKDYQWATNLEIDSACPNSAMVPQVKANIEKDENCLLSSGGTWAYMGSVKKTSERYLFWTSVDINREDVGAGKKIPMIIGTADGKYYVSSSTTATRNNKGAKYTVIIDHVNNVSDYKKYIQSGTKYDTLQDAYEVYEKVLKNDYPEYAKTE